MLSGRAPDPVLVMTELGQRVTPARRDDGLALERQLFEDAFRTGDATTGIRSFREQGPGQARFVVR